MEVNIRALRSRAPESQPLRRYEEIARLLTGHSHAAPEDGVRWVAALCRQLEIPPLRAYGVAASDIPALIAKASQASSMKANPLPLTPPNSNKLSPRGQTNLSLGAAVSSPRTDLSVPGPAPSRPRGAAWSGRPRLAFLPGISFVRGCPVLD